MKLTVEQLESIARDLESGFRVFIHRDSFEKIIVKDWRNDNSFSEEKWKDVLDELEKNHDKYIELEKLPQNELFAVMEGFVDTLEEDSLKKQLELVISLTNPFTKFVEIIKSSAELKSKWIEFKHEGCIDWIRSQVHHYNMNSKKSGIE